jgi:pimeloyl-ACP methyl ester carboxylesterase
MNTFVDGEMNLVFIHGLYSSGHGFKARYLRELFPDIVAPNFTGSLQERMEQLHQTLISRSIWRIIGSSFGGLMGALYVYQNPKSVNRLVLLAPALILPDFVKSVTGQIDVPTVIYHGRNDDVIPVDLVRALAENIFTNLLFNEVNEGHLLHKTVQSVDWHKLLVC